jgi:LPS export ABC transporter protein LptC
VNDFEKDTGSLFNVRHYRHVYATVAILFVLYLFKIFFLASTGSEGTSSLEFEMIHFVGRVASKIDWIMDADWLKRDTGKGMQYFTNINYVSYERDGKATVKADRGTQAIDSKDITFEGHVKAWNTKGHEYHTEKGYYQSVEKLLYSEVPVKIIRQNMTITGDWMVASTKEDTGEVRGNVHIVIEDTEEVNAGAKRG